MFITTVANESLDAIDVLLAIRRHATGDWGNLDSEDKAANDRAVTEETRILSAYEDRSGTKFWIITEWDRSSTTILLPSDY